MRGKLIVVALGAALAAGSLALAAPANGVIHEQVGAWCNGKDALEPPGISGGSNADNFAQPVESNGVVVGTFPNLEIGDSPAAKFPAGTNVLTNDEITAENLDHPSAEHCKNLNP